MTIGMNAPAQRRHAARAAAVGGHVLRRRQDAQHALPAACTAYANTAIDASVTPVAIVVVQRDLAVIEAMTILPGDRGGRRATPRHGTTAGTPRVRCAARIIKASFRE